MGQASGEFMLGLPKNEPEQKEYFFALEIDLDRIKSAIWTIQEKQVELISLGETQSWQNEKDLLESVDASLSSAIERLSPTGEIKEPSKVVFGLSADWIQENKILPEKVESLKKISQKLELTPLGFMVIPEAVVHWLKKIEGIPPTAILIDLAERKIMVSLVELGKVINTSVVVRSESLGSDLAEGLSRLGRQTPFPARILLYDGEEKLEQARQDLINWPWTEEGVNFLHLPKVEILSSDFDIKAIVLASASQVAEVETFEIKQETEKIQTQTFQETEQEVKEEKEIEKPPPELVEPEPNVFGFFKGQDISKMNLEIPEEQPEINFQTEKTATPSFLKTTKIGLKKLKFLNFSWLKKINFKRFFSLPGERFGVRETTSKKGLIIAILVGLVTLIILGGLFFLYWYWPKASIVIFAKPQVLQKDFTIKLDPTASRIDKTNLILPAKKVGTTVEEQKETPTTGTKLTGEKAKGEVTIYNRTAKEKIFLKGTQLIGPNNLQFTLDEDVTVASASAGSDYVTVPGKAVVKTTAGVLGSDSNLASGTEFAVGNFSRSDFIARNDSALSGGTSRQIQVVTKQDQEKILAAVQKELEQKAASDLKSQLNPQEKLIEESLKSTIVEKNFDKKIDEEANTIKLSLKLKVESLSFSENDFKELINDEIQKSVPTNFEYDSGQTETSFQLQGSSQGIFTFIASFKANLKPKFDVEEIKKNLVGKKPILGETYLGNLPNVQTFEIKISPRLPEKIATFPRVANHINIEIGLR